MMKMVDGKLVRGPKIGFQDVYHLYSHYLVRHIIDLESGAYDFFAGVDPADEKKNAQHFGISYHPFPFSNFRPPTEEQCRQVMRIIYAMKEPVYVHCHAGVDRTGFIVALYGVLRYGRCAHECWREAREEGMHLQYYWFWSDAFFERCRQLKEEFGWAE